MSSLATRRLYSSYKPMAEGKVRKLFSRGLITIVFSYLSRMPTNLTVCHTRCASLKYHTLLKTTIKFLYWKSQSRILFLRIMKIVCHQIIYRQHFPHHLIVFIVKFFRHTKFCLQNLHSSYYRHMSMAFTTWV